MRGRLLIIDHKVPTPDQDSGSASAFAYLQVLSRAGFDITFAPYNLVQPSGYARLLRRFGIKGRYNRALNRLGIKTLSVPEWTSIRSILEAVAPNCDVPLLIVRHMLSRYSISPDGWRPMQKLYFIRWILHFLRMEREAALSGDEAQAKLASALRTIELDLISRADATIVVSEYESGLLRELLPHAQ